MARKPVTGRPDITDEVMDRVALLPWWMGVGLAVIAYLLLHTLAVRVLPAVVSSQPLSRAAPTVMLMTLAKGLQYVVPLLFLASAGLSLFMRRARKKPLGTGPADLEADGLPVKE